MRRRVPGVLLTVGLLLTAGCGLPLPTGVHEPGALPAEQRPGSGDMQVLPPGPRDDASADEIVRDFFGAQSDPADAHASAREFLAPELRSTWRDTGTVTVLAAGLTVSPVAGAPNSFRVTSSRLGQIGPDGAYAPSGGSVDELVQVRKGAHGRWLITRAPDGLLLSTADRDQSFHVRNIYYLAPPVAPSAEASHLVPDRVFLPATSDSPAGLVRRLIAGPSRALGDSALTAFPVGTTVRSVRSDALGQVTVDLSEQVGKATALQKEQMSAQLIWTLRGSPGLFSHLRLQSAGRPVSVGPAGSESDVQDRGDLASYDPDGLTAQALLYYIGGRRLRVLDPTNEPAADASGRQDVDAAAASPRGGSLALLTRGPKTSELRTGPPSGPFGLRATGPALSSPCWGSGERGVWFLDGGRVTLAPLDGRPVAVPVDGVAGLGPISGLRVSRDGVRVALVVGPPGAGQLLVGRLADRGGALRIVGLRSIAPDVSDVGALSWDSATSLVVLGDVSGLTGPVRVTVDGSSVALVNRVGLEQKHPVSLAAAPDRPLVVGAIFKGVLALFLDNGRYYAQEKGIVGEKPFYPG